MEHKKILFVSHDANRAGSQLLLLQLLRLLKERGVPMHLLLCSGGVLETEFAEVTTITRLYQDNPAPSGFISGRLLKKVKLHRLYEEHSAQRESDRIVGELEAQNIGLVFVNSIANAEVYHDTLRFLHHLPMVLFVHELA
ncbi:MAG TPA: group 1 glycosyl transferase, partial [Dyadobacter sp.]|nr:group 1 glycosyl transferase [Dyadobacter sp.]